MTEEDVIELKRLAIAVTDASKALLDADAIWRQADSELTAYLHTIRAKILERQV